MASTSQRPEGRDGVLSTLDLIIQGLNLVKDTCGIPPAQAAFGSVSALLTMIRVNFSLLCDEFMSMFVQDSMANDQDCVDLGLCCADVCKALDRGLTERQLNELSQSVLRAIEQLTTYVWPAICTLSNPLTEVSFAGPWPRSRGRLSIGVNDMRSLELSMRGATKT